MSLVTVTGQWTDGITGDPYGKGNFEALASGFLMTSTQIGIVTPWIGVQLDSLGALSLPGTAPNSGIPMLASDSAGFGVGALTWNFKIIVAGMPNVIATDIPVNFSNGASQNIITLLEAAGWTPVIT